MYHSYPDAPPPARFGAEVIWQDSKRAHTDALVFAIGATFTEARTKVLDAFAELPFPEELDV